MLIWKRESCSCVQPGRTKVSGSSFADVRRLYRYAWLLYSLVMTVFGAQQVLRFLLFVPASMLGDIGREALVNGIPFSLCFPVAEHRGQPMLSRKDLVKVIEPLMRPERIPYGKAFKTVVIDAGHGGGDRAGCNERETPRDAGADRMRHQHGSDE